MRSLEISTQRILHNLIKQNQKLSSDSVLNQSGVKSSGWSPESRVQRSDSSVQNPAFNTCVQMWEIKYVEKTLKCLKIKEKLRSENSTEYYLQRNILLHFFLLQSIFHKHKIKKIVELARTLLLFI